MRSSSASLDLASAVQGAEVFCNKVAGRVPLRDVNTVRNTLRERKSLRHSEECSNCNGGEVVELHGDSCIEEWLL